MENLYTILVGYKNCPNLIVAGYDEIEKNIEYRKIEAEEYEDEYGKIEYFIIIKQAEKSKQDDLWKKI